jgi:hypothetical protein
MMPFQSKRVQEHRCSDKLLGKALIFSLLHARVSTKIALPAAFYEGMTDAAFQQVSLISLREHRCSDKLLGKALIFSLLHAGLLSKNFRFPLFFFARGQMPYFNKSP